jgi:hypothetical protein
MPLLACLLACLLAKIMLRTFDLSTFFTTPPAMPPNPPDARRVPAEDAGFTAMGEGLLKNIGFLRGATCYWMKVIFIITLCKTSSATHTARARQQEISDRPGGLSV